MSSQLELKTVVIREDGCFGVLLWKGRPFAVTLERTFENLRTVLSNGIYSCKRDFYHKGDYETFEILVTGHTRVLFHKGNRETDSEACILVAESFTWINSQTMIGDSKGGFAELMQLTTGLEEFEMEVTGR